LGKMALSSAGLPRALASADLKANAAFEIKE
jgi:hypothetical protein